MLTQEYVVTSSQGERERQLVEGLRTGSERSFEELVRTYGGAMLAVSRRLLRNEQDAQDALQDSFLQVHKSIGSFRGDSSLATWLHRIARNSALLRIRRASRRPEISLEPLLPVYDETGHRVGEVASLPAAPDALLERQEVRERVRSCVERLPLRYRAVIVLRDLEEKSTFEAAEVLGVSENVVKVRLHRARRALATLITREVPELAGAAQAD
jgi:RNA polymerase sigma-70 factor (ECF subfamily)